MSKQQKRVGHKITSEEEYEEMSQLLLNHCKPSDNCPESIRNAVLDQLVAWRQSQKG